MRAVLLALALLLPLQAQGQSNDTSNPIIARMAAFVDAYNARDLTTLTAIYAPDAALLVPGEVSINGREAIGAYYAAAFTANPRDLQFMTFDIRATDDTAVEIGEIVVFVGETRINARYMHLWEVRDGDILLVRDMFHILGTQ